MDTKQHLIPGPRKVFSLNLRRALWLIPWVSLLAVVGLAAPAQAAPTLEKIGENLYAYIANDDLNSNATFLVGPASILVVDTGLTKEHAQKLLRAIRSVSPLPIQYVVNTHYHPDHQQGNRILAPDAVILSTTWTRQRTLEIQAVQTSSGESGPDATSFQVAQVTTQNSLTLHLGEYPVRIYHPGPAHTMGDAVVYFAHQRVVATGDLFLTNSSPAMDQGSVVNWIKALEDILALPMDAVIPGHFAVASKQELGRFKNYLADLLQQVAALHRAGASLQEVRQRIDVSNYADFLQYPQYGATFAGNAEAIFRQLESE